MTRDEAKKRLKVWLICANCPEEKKCYDSYLHSTCEYTDYCDEVPIEEAVKVAIEALEQEPKTGHWVDSNSFLMVVMGDTVVNLPAKECSICHKPHIKGYGADFCPNCGAKMSEGGET